MLLPTPTASVGPIGSTYTEPQDVAQSSLIISELAITKPCNPGYLAGVARRQYVVPEVVNSRLVRPPLP